MISNQLVFLSSTYFMYALVHFFLILRLCNARAKHRREEKEKKNNIAYIYTHCWMTHCRTLNACQLTFLLVESPNYVECYFFSFSLARSYRFLIEIKTKSLNFATESFSIVNYEINFIFV